MGSHGGALGDSPPAAGANTVVPPGLAAGDTYRLIFVTDGSILGNAPDIADYNAFVAAAANADPGLASLNTTWTALLSTADVNVLDNTSLSLTDSTTPFYNTLGQPIATGVTTTSPYALVWTGTQPHDAATAFFAVGLTSGIAGDSTELGDGWTQSDAYFTTNQWAVYGISGVLTVTPEPSTLLTAGLAALFAWTRSRLRVGGRR